MDTTPAGVGMETGTGSFPPVTIYTGDDCHWCGKAKKYLTQRGVPYIERNVATEEGAAEEAIRLSGHRGVPVIVVGERVIEGFRRADLDAALNLGALDAVTEAQLPPAQDAIAAAIAAARIAWTPEQEAMAAQLPQLVDTYALCIYVGQQFDYNLALCDNTLRHVTAFLANQPAADPAAVLALLDSLEISCDCRFASNICAR